LDAASERMKELDLSQRDLAKEIGLGDNSQGTVSRAAG
jgi:transcriptional regulator with XRE-family HTH domain